ncbi:hypothetical protein BCR42DRAFT_412616 [Absidia repens]|uniref:Far11/STRP C-terminal domain-containing protein n=1 Tax=Absidia repens TaxID=90262 RepID=A0A1X2IK03_9FUNG|nr:hypothetical protein BCR42DRAFT_412616 [Absidia repens]
MSTTQDQDHHILLDPAHMKEMVNALPKNQKHHHEQYQYADTEDLKTELNEFFSYNETKLLLTEHEESIKGWRSMKPKEQRQHIRRLLTTLKKKKKTEGKKSLLHQEQSNAAKQLICVILSEPDVQPPTPYDDDDRELYHLSQTIECIIQYGGLALVCRRLKRMMNKISASNNVTKEMGLEIDLYITLTYLIIETRRQLKYDHLSSSSADHPLEPSFIECLFCFIGQIQDYHVEHLPVRKMMLLLWKSMLATFGDRLEHIQSIQKDNLTTSTGNKSTLQDYYKFVEETTERFPGYEPPTSMLPSSLAVKPSNSTLSAMSLVSDSHKVDLPYQVFCSSSNNSSKSNSKKKSKSSSSSGRQADFPVALPLNQTGPSVPFSVVEAGQIYLSHLHNSKASQQLIQQREYVMHSSSPSSSASSSTSSSLPSLSSSSSTTSYSPSSDNMSIFDQFEHFYKSIVPELQNVVVFFLKQLLSTIAPTSPSLDDTPEHVDSLRNSQVLCKSISAILLLLLKWTKLSHVLKFEYISELLVDSGCILLILKIIGLQDVVSLVGNETDMDQFSLFKKPADMTAPPSEYTNNRNMFWMINLLRVLQKLTKNKPNRVMVMVQYKSSTVFKKLLKISHPMMELYTLKILKSQVPFQTRKWRANNMKIISAIYMKCTTSLYDDWMSKSETDEDLLDGKAEEINIRLLTRIYHDERYHIPRAEDEDEEDVIDADALELDPSFVASYEIWLDDEVYQEDDHQQKQECLTIELDDENHDTIELDDNHNAIELDDDHQDTIELDLHGMQDDFLSIDLEENDDDDDDDDDLLDDDDDDDDESDEMTLDTPVTSSMPHIPDYFYTHKQVASDDADDDNSGYYDQENTMDKNELHDPTTAQMDCSLMTNLHLHQQQAWTPLPLASSNHRSTC